MEYIDDGLDLSKYIRKNYRDMIHNEKKWKVLLF